MIVGGVDSSIQSCPDDIAACGCSRPGLYRRVFSSSGPGASLRLFRTDCCLTGASLDSERGGENGRQNSGPTGRSAADLRPAPIPALGRHVHGCRAGAPVQPARERSIWRLRDRTRCWFRLRGKREFRCFLCTGWELSRGYLCFEREWRGPAMTSWQVGDAWVTVGKVGSSIPACAAAIQARGAG